MGAFWSKGYEATSMADLCCCTGLHKGSLYQAFGDKHQLFMDALQHYSETQIRDVAGVVSDSESPLANIRAVMDKICDHAGNDNGCMAINSMVELAPHDPEVKAAVRGFAQKRLGLMADMIARAQEQGEISLQREPEKMARQLMMTLAGGAVMVKGFIEADDIRETLSELIDSWV